MRWKHSIEAVILARSDHIVNRMRRSKTVANRPDPDKDACKRRNVIEYCFAACKQ